MRKKRATCADLSEKMIDDIIYAARRGHPIVKIAEAIGMSSQKMQAIIQDRRGIWLADEKKTCNLKYDFLCERWIEV